jgi:hypothetical protein
MGHFDSQRRYDRRKSAELADVGELPAIANPQRRLACQRDLHLFLTSYFPASTGLKPFSDDHRKAISRIESSALDGGLFWQMFPRGAGKTTISENSSLWAVLYGHRKFVPVFGADAKAATDNIDSIKLELSENDLLYDDFPEVCHPIRALENKPQRCASQTHTIWTPCEECGESGKVFKEGSSGAPREMNCPACGGKGAKGDAKHTHIEWRGDTIVLPTVRVHDGWGTAEGPKPDAAWVPSVASGAILKSRGIMGGSRGLKHKRPDGTQQRPDFILIDDPQTDDSASTALQVNKRLNVVRKNILKLGGHGRKLAVVMNATCIRKGDMVDRIADAKAFPAWQGVRIKMVRKWSDAHETLWLTDYARLRNTYDPDVLGDQQRAHREATAFYLRNRAKMDAGCQVFWEHCYDPDTEESAIQHAYNLLIDDGPEVFASECQNDPQEDKEEGQQQTLSPREIGQKLNGLGRGELPASATRLTVFIDPNQSLLAWIACAFAQDFTGDVVDYGTYPDQGRPYFSMKDARHTLEKAAKGAGSFEAALYAGLDALVNQLMGREWKRQDGALLKPERILIDANWPKATDVVEKFCRQSPHAAILLPSRGHFVGAKSKPMGQYKDDGARTGLNWRIPSVRGTRQIRHVVFDTNFWKGFFHARIGTPMGGKGALTLFGKPSKDGRRINQHEMLCDHFTSEYGVEVEAKGRKVVEFSLKPGRPDNDLLDGVVGCYVAASMCGCSLITTTTPPRPQKKRKNVSYL